MPDPDQTPIVLPQDCAVMADVRIQIDRLDRALVGLITERLGYIARAAQLKQARNTVHDQARIEDVIAKVRKSASERGAPPDLFEAVWRELVARSIAHEFVLFDAKQAT